MAIDDSKIKSVKAGVKLMIGLSLAFFFFWYYWLPSFSNHISKPQAEPLKAAADIADTSRVPSLAHQSLLPVVDPEGQKKELNGLAPAEQSTHLFSPSRLQAGEPGVGIAEVGEKVFLLPFASQPSISGGLTDKSQLPPLDAKQEELMTLILKAKSLDEQKNLLAASPQLLNGGLEKRIAFEAEQLSNSGHFAQAQMTFQLEQSLAERLGDKAAVAAALRAQGDCGLWQGKNQEAIQSFQRALELSESLMLKYEAAFCLKGLGSASHIQGRFAEALSYYQRSLEIGEQLQNPRLIANAELGKGATYQTQGQLTQALDCLNHSLRLETEMNSKEGIARCLVNLGNLYLLQGEYTIALEHYQKGLLAIQALNRIPWMVTLLNNIGLIYQVQGNYNLALEYYQRALTLNQERLGNKDGIALSLISMGEAEVKKGSLEEAVKHLQQALLLANEQNNNKYKAFALHYLGEVENQRKNFNLALNYYQKCLALASAMEHKTLLVNLNQSIMQTYYALGNYPKAIASAEQNIRLCNEIGYPEKVWSAYLTAGRSYLKLEETAKAQQAFGAAIEAIEQLRAHIVGDEQAQQRYFENKTQPYLALLALDVQQKHPFDALVMAEKSKSRVLVDVLQSGHVQISKALNPEEKEQERQLNEQMEALERQIMYEEMRLQGASGQLKSLNEHLAKVRLQREDFLTQLYASHPQLQMQRGQLAPLTPREMDQLLPASQEAVLEFAVLDNEICLFVLTRHDAAAAGGSSINLQVYEIPISRKELDQQVVRFEQQLANCEPGYSVLGRELYRRLLKPAEQQLKGVTTLGIIPDGILWKLPFQALQPQASSFLLNQYAIYYAPSLTALEAMRREDNGRAGATQLLAYGNPSLPQGISAKSSVLRSRGLAANLMDAEEEVQALKRLYGEHSLVRIRSDATATKALQEMENYQILHFATHGILDDRDPLYSYLALAPDDAANGKDGRLEANEILGLNLKAELAILSACQSAGGRIGAGEGLIGMSWAFFVAGCPTTVVSQWKVDSRSSRQLMVDFHRNLAKSVPGSDPPTMARALQQAALRLQQSALFRHPFYWAPFVVMGKNATLF